MQPSNPASVFVSGSDQESFHYEPGAYPYYVIAHGPSYIPLSVMVFADSPEHALRILLDMLVFFQAAIDKYAAYKKRVDAYDKHDLVGIHQRRLDTLRKAIAEEDGYKLHIEQADRGQIYKIGWGANDTLI